MPWANDAAARQASSATYSDPEYKTNRKAALKRANGRCERCGTRRKPLQVDHATPVTQGGTHALSNLQVLCSGKGSCHARKTAQEGGGYRKTNQTGDDPAPTPRTAW